MYYYNMNNNNKHTKSDLNSYLIGDNMDEEIIVEYATKQIINIITDYKNLQTCCELFKCDESVLRRLELMNTQVSALEQVLFKSVLKNLTVSDLLEIQYVDTLLVHTEILKMSFESELNQLISNLGFMSAIELDAYKHSEEYKRAEKIAMCLFFVNKMRESAEKLFTLIRNLTQEASLAVA